MLPGQRSIGGKSNQTDHFGSYSFAWWTNGVDRGGKRHWPGVPNDENPLGFTRNSGQSGVGLRGLGSNNTLVLINGRRAPLSGRGFLKRNAAVLQQAWSKG